MKQQTEVNAQEQAEAFRAKCLQQSGLSYSFAAVLPLALSLILGLIVRAALDTTFTNGENYPDWYTYCIFLIPQLSFALLAAAYFYRTREKIAVPFKKCAWRYFPIAILMQFGLLFSLSVLNEYFIDGLGKLGYVSSDTPLPSLDGWNLLPALLVIAALPAVLEEVFFRGILTRNLHASGWGIVPVVFLSAAMFSLYHGRPEQTVYQFICGACFALIAVRSGSILPTMIAHFANNAAILLLTAFGYGDLQAALPEGGYIALCVVSALCFAAAAGYLIFFDRRNSEGKGMRGGKVFFLAAAVGLAILAVEWIYALVTGFTHG